MHRRRVGAQALPYSSARPDLVGVAYLITPGHLRQAGEGPVLRAKTSVVTR